MYDLIIIGASAAGISASIYAARRKLNFLVVSENIGGEVATSGEIENWPGTIHTDGITLAENFKKHAEANQVRFEVPWKAVKIEQKANYHIVQVKNDSQTNTYETKTVLITSGIHPRHLQVPGEDKLYGKGVTYCTVCDGPLYKGKTTVTIGGGNSALESVLMMSAIAKKVYVLNINPTFKGDQILIDKLLQAKNVEVIYKAQTKEITGDKFVTGVKYADANGQDARLAVDGVMIHIGMIPNSDFVDCVDKNNFREIKVNTNCATNCPGIFAAGDVTDVPYKQIAIAAGQGVVAALAAIEYINKWQAVSTVNC
jgi:thioredoxin reductase